MSTLVKNPTQCQKILEVLEKADGAWVHGWVFLRDMYLSQYHARIWELKRKGYNIEAGEPDSYGVKSYRLVRDNLFSK